MVLQGDNLSAFNESYLEVSFLPRNTSNHISYAASISVYSLINGTTGDGMPGDPYVLSCPSLWVGLAWNNSYWCEGVDFYNTTTHKSTSGISEPTAIQGGSVVNVTFLGTPHTGPVEIWANDSNHPADSFSATLNSATVGNYSFTPRFYAACQTCTLNWGMGYGEGIGIGMCPNVAAFPCDSYDIYPWSYDPPVEFGIPEFWNGSGYATDFTYLGFESASGACSLNLGGSAPVSVCIQPPTSTNFYPYFTFNGTRMDFGPSFPWTTWDFGGPSIEYNVLASMTAVTPLRIDGIADSSNGGYVLGGQSFNVTTRLQVVGHLTNGSLVYRVGASAWSSVPLSQVNGTSTYGWFNGTVPSTGGDGTITYFLYAVDRAGLGVPSSEFTVLRGPLPHFTVDVAVVPAFCGGTTINGTKVNNGGSISLEPGTYSLVARGCYPYTDPVFSTTRNLVAHGLLGNLVVRGNGTLTLTFTFTPPPLKITIATTPVTCGSIEFDGTAYADGSVVTVTWGVSYTLADEPCGNDPVFGGYAFSGTSNGTFNISVSDSYQSIVATSNGTLSVTYLTSTGADPIYFETSPSHCTGIYLLGVLYLDGTSISIAAGTYAIAPDPCARWGFLDWKVFGSSSYTSGNNLTIAGSTTLEEVNYRLTIISVITSPSICGTVEIDGTNYTNGAEVVVANNSTHLAYAHPCGGYTTLAFTATGGLSLVGSLLTANGSGELIATYLNGSAPDFVGFITQPAYCGYVTFQGSRFYDTNFTSVSPGTIATLTATPTCANLGFLAWQAEGPNITISGNTVTINSFGAITAIFASLAPLFIYTSPIGCGGVSVDGVPYADGSTPSYPSTSTLNLSADPCAGYSFEGWIHSDPLNVSDLFAANTTATINGPASLTAVFVPTAYRVQVFETPPNCGTIKLNNVNAFNDSNFSLPASNYSLDIRPCTGYHVLGFTVVGGLEVVNNSRQLAVTGSGNLTILLQPVPPVLVLDLPSSTLSGVAVSIAATVGTLVPPYNLYSYEWTFGDGTTAHTTDGANFTDHTYSAPGLYDVTVSVTDPLGRTTAANGTILVVSPPSTATLNDLLPAGVALAAAAVAILAAYWYTTPRAGPAPAEGEETPSDTYGAEGAPAPELPAPSEAAVEEPVPKEP